MEVRVREAQPEDCEAIQQIAEQGWRKAHAPIIGPALVEDFLTTYYSRAKIIDRIANQSIRLNVSYAADTTRILGFVTVTDDAERTCRFQLAQLYVRPSHWGEGIGSLLLHSAEEPVIQSTANRMRLGVMVGNERAEDFYRSHGYEVIDERYDERINATSRILEKSFTNDNGSDSC